MVSKETRRESYEKVDKVTRYKQIVEIIANLGSCSAKEVAVEMCNLGYTPTEERNFSAPRLTELVKLGVVDMVGKKVCSYTKKSVTVYELINT